MLEIRRGKATRSYENTFFREFAKNLKDFFDKKKIDGLLIANSDCSVEQRLQIDALLITENVACIIDFKNFGGKIILPKGEQDFREKIWTNENGDIIKGGSSINPYQQLYKQKKSLTWVYHNFIKDNLSQADFFEPGHINKIICFQRQIFIDGEIPSKDENSFFIIDKSNYLEKIKDIIEVKDEKVCLSKKSFEAFKGIFKADEFDLKEQYGSIVEVESLFKRSDYGTLYESQKIILNEVDKFLQSDNQICIIRGTTNSGKSYTIPFIQELAYKNNIQETEIFMQSTRIVNNLFLSQGIKDVNSIYSYIYGGKLDNKEDEESEEDGENIDGNNIETVPLKKCENNDDALFIVDESQLVSDSFYESLDLIFGTGFLLKDFIYFAEVTQTKRKIIFIGDPYQIQLGKIEESPLNEIYLKNKYNLNVQVIDILDKPEFSDITKQSLSIVNGIKQDCYSDIEIIDGEGFSFIGKKDYLEYISNIAKENNGHVLCYSNEDSLKVNFWIKEKILSNGKDISVGDMIYFDNNLSIENENDPFAQPQKIYNGEFGFVISILDKNIVTISIGKNNPKKIDLEFLKLRIKLKESGNEVVVLSLENYRKSKKGELSKDELLAYKIYLQQLAQSELENFDNKYKIDETTQYLIKQHKEGKRVKTKLIKSFQKLLRSQPSTEYYKRKNSALLRFGWAMTVHKALSYKWDRIVLNFDPGDLVGKNNSSYFRWLYSALTRAKKKIDLINYKAITPFDKVEFYDKNTGKKPDDIFFISKSKEKDLFLFEFKEYFEGILKKDSTQNRINNIEDKQFQQTYSISFQNSNIKISFWYNNEGEFKLNKIGIEPRLLQVIKNYNNLDFEKINSEWRKKLYKKLKTYLEEINLRITQIKQTAFKDDIIIQDGDDENLYLSFWYNGIGLFTNITANYYDNINTWDNFKKNLYENFSISENKDNVFSKENKVTMKKLSDGIYFDAGTGRGLGVEISVTDKLGNNLLYQIIDDGTTNEHGKFLLGKDVTNNYGELFACKCALDIAIRSNIKNIYGDSQLVINYWSKGQFNEKGLDNATIDLIKKVVILRSNFEGNGGKIDHVSGDINPADLGFHK